MKKLLEIKKLHVSIKNKQILNGINLNIDQGQVHAIMGPNGSGKSTLALTLMGNPKYKIESGQIFFAGKDITNIPVDQRAKLGMFLSLQHPYEIEGVTLRDFLRQAYNSIYSDNHLSPKEFNKLLNEKLQELKISESFVDRYLNIGFSGGEKKLAETLQMAVLNPKLAILDELDSGLDIDALQNVCNSINNLKKSNPKISILIITHYQRILKFLKPGFVHVMQNGKIVQSGDFGLAEQLEKTGYK
ncbi:MAG: Fe-S cluster assembly ATPase SufC [bacterium]